MNFITLQNSDQRVVETSTLLSLLQFVALAAPAIAILMQVTREVDSGYFVFHLLTSSLILIIFGGLIITYRLFITIGQPILSFGIILIFGSFVVLAIALAYSTITTALASQPEMEISDLPDYAVTTVRKVGPSLLSIVMVAVSFGGTVLLIRGIVNDYLSYGFFAGQDALTPTIFFWVIASLLGIESIIKLIENDVLPGSDFGEVANGSFIVVFAWIIGYTIFVGPFFLVGFGLVAVKLYILPLPSSHFILNVPYVWAGLVAVILFAVDVDI